MRCPCDRCCGEAIEEPDNFETESLQEAVKQFEDWLYVSVYDGDGQSVECSSSPVSARDWIMGTGNLFDGGACDDNSAALDVSIHGNWTRASLIRLARYLGAGSKMND